MGLYLGPPTVVLEGGAVSYERGAPVYEAKDSHGRDTRCAVADFPLRLLPRQDEKVLEPGGVRQARHPPRVCSRALPPTLTTVEATQGQMYGFFSQLPHNFEVASVGD